MPGVNGNFEILVPACTTTSEYHYPEYRASLQSTTIWRARRPQSTTIRRRRRPRSTTTRRVRRPRSTTTRRVRRPQSTTTQSTEQPQVPLPRVQSNLKTTTSEYYYPKCTATHADTDRGSQEYHEQLLQTKLNELDKKYQEKQDAADGIKAVIEVLDYELWDLRAKLSELKAGPEQDRLFEKYKAESQAMDEKCKALTALKKK
ncbi:hypothetical protein BASA83_012382 [Batrachochytrium salamandrivorans]|nr:hypothetical protein BASA83_012382 [Batrachochytrium salamandrivorans]